MRKLIVSEFVSLDGVMQAPGGKDEDRDDGFEHGGWTVPYWHDDIGGAFGALMQGVDAFLLGRRTYVTHAEAFEPMPAGDPFGDMMNAPKKYVVSTTITKPIWRNTTDHPRQRHRIDSGDQGRARRHHPHRRQQSTRARHDCARPGRRAAPARVPADARQRQTSPPGRCARDLRTRVSGAVSDRRGRAALPATAAVMMDVALRARYCLSNTTLYFSFGALTGVPSMISVFPSADTE